MEATTSIASSSSSMLYSAAVGEMDLWEECEQVSSLDDAGAVHRCLLDRCTRMLQRSADEAAATADQADQLLRVACADWLAECQNATEPQELPCEDSNIFESFFLFVYLPLFVVCWLGNLTNIIIYCHRYWKASTTIRLLFAKVV